MKEEFDVSGYEVLADVLAKAYDQAARGKGVQRHGLGKPYLENPIIKEVIELGPASLVYQVRKKSREAMNLPFNMAKEEMLGAIVYAAALYIYYDIKETKQNEINLMEETRNVSDYAISSNHN